jgi:hypothetical protein
MDSAAIGAWIAHIAFWTLIVYGWTVQMLTVSHSATFVALWATGFVGLPHVMYAAAHAMFPWFVAVLDIALVFMIFKGDIRLT